LKHIPPPSPQKEREREGGREEKSVTRKMQAQMGVGLHVQWSLKLSNLNVKWSGLTFQQNSSASYFMKSDLQFWNCYNHTYGTIFLAAMHICE